MGIIITWLSIATPIACIVQSQRVTDYIIAELK